MSVPVEGKCFGKVSGGSRIKLNYGSVSVPVEGKCFGKASVQEPYRARVSDAKSTHPVEVFINREKFSALTDF